MPALAKMVTIDAELLPVEEGHVLLPAVM